MKNFLKSYWAIALLIMFFVITLFPPFNWYLSNSLSTKEKNKYEGKVGDQLPISSYDFIFGSSIKKEKFEYLDYEFVMLNDKFERKYFKDTIDVPLQRSLITYELILNYILSSLIIFLLYLLSEKRKKFSDGKIPNSHTHELHNKVKKLTRFIPRFIISWSNYCYGAGGMTGFLYWVYVFLTPLLIIIGLFIYFILSL